MLPFFGIGTVAAACSDGFSVPVGFVLSFGCRISVSQEELMDARSTEIFQM